MIDKLYVFDGTDFAEVEQDYIFEIIFEDNGTNSLDKLTVKFDQRILEEDYSPTFFREVRFEVDGEVVFGGRVSIPNEGGGMYSVVCYSYGEEFLDKIVNEIYEDEDVADIVADLIDKYTDLTYVGVDATGIVLERIVFRERPLSDVLQFLSESLFYGISTDWQKQADFRPIDESDSGVVLEYGENKNVVFPVMWDRNSSDVVTRLRLEGDLESFNTTENFTATASQEIFTLVYEPFGNIVVTVDGTEQVGEVSGSNEGDYFVKRENKEIVFNTPLTGGEDVVITYEYLRPIKVEAQVDLFDDFGKRIEKVKFLKKKFIRSYDSARQFAQKYLSIFGVPNLTGSPVIIGYNKELVAGRTVTCIDALNHVDDVLTIDSVSYMYPKRQMKINVGRRREFVWDWQKEVMQRIQEGASQDVNVDILQSYVKINANLRTRFFLNNFRFERLIHDSWIWGKSIWGTDRWGDRRDGDTFTSYNSLSPYDVGSFWEITGSFTALEGTFTLASGTEAKYTGRDGTGDFLFTNGKAEVEFDANDLGELGVFVRYVDADNNIQIKLKPTEFEVIETISGSSQQISFGSGISLSGKEVVTIRATNEMRIYTGSIEINESNIPLSLTTQGSFFIKNFDGNQKVHKVSLYKGD